MLGKNIRNPLGQGFTPIQAGAIREHDHTKHIPLILRRDKTAWDGLEQGEGCQKHRRQNPQRHTDPFHRQRDPTGILPGHAIQPLIETLEYFWRLVLCRFQ